MANHPNRSRSGGRDRDTSNVPATLPDKPSELIRLALADLRKVEGDFCYIVNMGVWHLAKPDRCEVCMAGAIIAGTLKAPPDLSVTPKSFDYETCRKLFAIDRLREAHRPEMMRSAAILGRFQPIGWTNPVPDYDIDPEGFHRVLNALADAFEADGQ